MTSGSDSVMAAHLGGLAVKIAQVVRLYSTGMVPVHLGLKGSLFLLNHYQ